jgi:NAD(P)-dependent dehydrogenase (short-subunit alcohol dehydrogenase family)
MRIIVLGHTGNIGTALAPMLENAGHEVIRVSRSSGDYQLDYTDSSAIDQFYREVGQFDAVIVVAGRDGYFGPIETVGRNEFEIGFYRKMMGQFNMVLIGQKFINPGGFFILTSGFLSDVPNPNSLVLGTVNAAVNAFVKHAATMLPKGIRINVVSPGVVVRHQPATGDARVNSTDLAEAYLNVLNSDMTGKTIRAWNLNYQGKLYRDLLD